MPESREFVGAGTVVVRRGMLLCALLASGGCGGAGEARAPGDGSAPGEDTGVDRPATDPRRAGRHGRRG